MSETASALHGWDTFYVIVGSSSAALTGLMFVVVTLLPEARRRAGATDAALSAFATPTILHFCAALLISAMLTAPWGGLWQPGLAASLSGLAGLIYSAIVTRRVHRSTQYTAVFEDWLWHVLLPVASYLTLVVSGLLLGKDTTGALFGMAASTLTLLFIGIHNAWDAVTYITFDLKPVEPKNNAKTRR
jgi:hypothetical protein